MCDAGAVEEPPFLRRDRSLVADRERREDAGRRRRAEMRLEPIAHRFARAFHVIEKAVAGSEATTLALLPHVPRRSQAALEQPGFVIEAVGIDVAMRAARSEERRV